MAPTFYRPLGRFERWLATRADTPPGFYTNVIAWARLECASDGNLADLESYIRTRLAELYATVPNLRLVCYEKSTNEAQVFYDVGGTPEVSGETLTSDASSLFLPVEFRQTDCKDASARHKSVEDIIEEVLGASFPILPPQTDIAADKAPKNPTRSKDASTPRWSDWLRWRLVVLLHPAEQGGSAYADMALAYAHDIADGKSGMALLSMLLDPTRKPFTDWGSLVASRPQSKQQLDTFPGTHLPVEAVASGTEIPVRKLLSDAFQELLIPPFLKRMWFLEDYFVGVVPPGNEKGYDVPDLAVVKASPASIILFHLPAEDTPKILRACKANGMKMHGALVAASLLATARLAERIEQRDSARAVTGLANRKLPGSGKQSTLKIRINNPVDLRSMFCGLPDELGPEFPVGPFIAVANTDHVLPYPPNASSKETFWALAKESTSLIAESVASSAQVIGLMGWIGDTKDWHAFQAGNRGGYPGGRMESIMVSNVRSWTFPPLPVGDSKTPWQVVAAGFSQDSEVTGGLLDLDVATVNGVVSGAFNWREGVGGVTREDAEAWCRWWKEEIEAATS